MEEKELEKRMYFLVPYNISPIQQAIQAGHAALEYARMYHFDEEYIDFIENWKTWMILNGGTTNDQYANLGSLNQALVDIQNAGVKHNIFREPDLNNALTAICLVVDERVFNKELCPDFKDWAINTGIKAYDLYDKTPTYDRYLESYKEEFGEDIYFLKELLNSKKLA